MRAYFAFCCTVLLRAYLQQSGQHFRMQKRWRLRDQQEESYRLQGMSLAEVPNGGHVQIRLPLRPALQLVQDTLPATGTIPAGTKSPDQRSQIRVREGVRFVRRRE